MSDDKINIENLEWYIQLQENAVNSNRYILAPNEQLTLSERVKKLSEFITKVDKRAKLKVEHNSITPNQICISTVVKSIKICDIKSFLEVTKGLDGIDVMPRTDGKMELVFTYTDLLTIVPKY